MIDAPSAWLGPGAADRVPRCISTAASCAALRPARGAPMPCSGKPLAANPEGEAIVCGDARLTYRELRAAGVGWSPPALRARAIGRGDRVALLLGNDIAFPVVLFAALRLGAIAVPISIREQTPGLAYMLAHCGAKVLVHDTDLADRLPARVGDASTRGTASRVSPGRRDGRPRCPLREVVRDEAAPPPAPSTRRIRPSSSTRPARPAGPRAPC